MLDQQLYQGGEPSVAPEASNEPQIEIEEQEEDYARAVAAPLPPGFGMTLGNALRRVLLSSLPGAAVTSVRIEGALHEFSTIANVKEDTLEFLLNVKELRLRALSDRPGTLILDVSNRQGEVTAADIQVPEHYEVVNPELHLATLDSNEGRLHVEFNVELGRGYVPAGQSDGLPIGTIPVDAIFSPVRKVNYKIGHTRVGQATNHDKLILEVWTDGSISAVDAISQSADIVIEQFRLFSHMGRPVLPAVERGLGAGIVLTPETFNMPIEDLQLSMRAYNCLRRSGLMTVGQVLAKSEEELLALRNFGRKSYDELRSKLNEMGLLPQEQPEEEMMEAPSLEDEEEEPFIAVPSPIEEAPSPMEEGRAAVNGATEETQPAEAKAAAVEAAPAKTAPAKKKGKKKEAPKSEEVAAEAEPPAAEEEEGLAARLTPEQRKRLLDLMQEGEE